ncbi:MAG: NifU family protein [Acidobacteriota bacterium]|nr:NifU family protein [Acidobacteriota bacterium]
MFEITDEAKKKVVEFMESEEEKGLALRVGVKAPGDFEFGLVPGDDRAEDDVDIDAGGFHVFIDRASAPHLDNARFEFVESGEQSGFRIVAGGPTWDDPLAKKVQDVINTQINPAVASHGGHVTLLDVKDDRAFVKLGGGCQGCGMASVTLKHGIEVMIQEAVPEIREIIDTTDHAGGTNPFFSPAKGAGGSPFA